MLFRDRVTPPGAQVSSLDFHFVGGLPSPCYDLTDAAHGLRVRRHDADGAHVVKDVFGRNGFSANARFGKRNVFRNTGAQVMTDHEHVEVFVNGIHGKRHAWIGGGRQDVRFPADADNVGGMAASRSFGMKGMNRASAECANAVVYKARLVQRVRVNGDLYVVFVRNVETR